MAFDIKDYVDVAERAQQFFARYPEGSIQCHPATVHEVNGRFLIGVVAEAYRTPDDPRPGIGQAWEPFPGKTPYTKDSECMNAETSAVGRALAWLGFGGKRIASADEVAARRSESDGEPRSQARGASGRPTSVWPADDDPGARATWTEERLVHIATLLRSQPDTIARRILDKHPGVGSWQDMDPDEWVKSVTRFMEWAERARK